MLPGVDPAAMTAELERERRAIRVRVGGEERWAAADDAGLLRDAFGVVPPGGLPDAFIADVPDALARIAARYAAAHGPFTTRELGARYGVDFGVRAARARAHGPPGPGRAAPGGLRAGVVRRGGPA